MRKTLLLLTLKAKDERSKVLKQALKQGMAEKGGRHGRYDEVYHGGCCGIGFITFGNLSKNKAQPKCTKGLCKALEKKL